MAFGDLTLSGAINAGLGIYDFLQAQRARNELDAQYDQLNKLLMASLSRDATTYNDIASRAGQLEATLRKAFEALGPRTPVTQGDIEQRQAALERQYLEDVNSAFETTASRGFANLRERGMDNSTYATDQMAQLAARGAQAKAEARNQAYNDAIAQLTNRQKLIDTDRDNIFDEYTNIIGSPVNLLRGGTSVTSNIGNIMNGIGSQLQQAGNTTGVLQSQLTEMFKNANGWGNKTIGDIFK
jgi:hypothetical protein